jgi:hypothetical protein
MKLRRPPSKAAFSISMGGMKSTRPNATEEEERTSPFSELYQLHLDVEAIARELRERRKRRWGPLRDHIDALHEISNRLKVLDTQRKANFPDLHYTQTKFL